MLHKSNETTVRLPKVFIIKEASALEDVVRLDHIDAVVFLFQLFQKCLIKVLNIDLWKCYLSYVRDTKSSLPNFR